MGNRADPTLLAALSHDDQLMNTTPVELVQSSKVQKDNVFKKYLVVQWEASLSVLLTDQHEGETHFACFDFRDSVVLLMSTGLRSVSFRDSKSNTKL